jgi:hypothetical protein
MYESLPPFLSDWVARKAADMGLPGPDDYIVLMLRLEKQNQALAAVDHLIHPHAASPVVQLTRSRAAHQAA